MNMTSGVSSGMIDAVLIVWFLLTALSAIYVAWDAWTNNPELGVMKVGWFLVTLYIGPIGLALYPLVQRATAWPARKVRRTSVETVARLDYSLYGG